MREREMEMEEVRGTVCVTGAGGYVASWVVKLLLSKGYKVHGTVRNPNDEKNGHLKKLENASENLGLFKADLLDYDSISAAISGCKGVFHVACPVFPTKLSNPEDVIAPAVTGTLNVLKACSEAKVKRVVIVSSAASIIMNPNWPKDKVMDESCWSDEEFCRATEAWYYLAKTQADAEAMAYAKKHGLDVVAICPSLVWGPMLQSTVNASSSVLLKYLKGEGAPTDNTKRSIVDVRDVANAVVLAYEKPEVSGRYICNSHQIGVRELIDILKGLYPNYDYPKEFIEVNSNFRLTSEKLKKLGWRCRTLEVTLVDSVECYKEAGLLSKLEQCTN